MILTAFHLFIYLFVCLFWGVYKCHVSNLGDVWITKVVYNFNFMRAENTKKYEVEKVICEPFP